MKLIKIFTALILFVTCFQNLHSQTLFTDDFDYPVRDSLEGMGGWFRSGGNTQNNVTVVSPGLTYSGYPGSGIGNSLYFSNYSNGDIVLHNFTTQTSGSLYMAFMVRVEYLGITATHGYNIAFDQSGGPTSINTMLYIQKINSTNFKFGIAKMGQDVAYETSAHSTDYTYLVVLKYMFISGSDNDRVKLYAFTTGVPSSEPANPHAETITGNDLLDIGQVAVSNSYIQMGLNQSIVKIDGIRVGTSWSGAVLTGITPTSNEVLEGFSLSQNYPNPFNPVTNINFSIPGSQNVKITVTDVLGKQVAELVNEKLSAGSYTVDFDGANLSSGIYFYRMQTEGFNEVKKMILVK